MKTTVNILRDFPYLDGDVSRTMKAGTVGDVDAAHVDGLKKAGCISAIEEAQGASGTTNPGKGGAPAPAPGEQDQGARSRTAEPAEERAAVAIPEDWQKLPWDALKSLAAKLTDDPVKTKVDAVAAIEAEVARRAAAA